VAAFATLVQCVFYSISSENLGIHSNFLAVERSASGISGAAPEKISIREFFCTVLTAASSP
jgi:hypothetical protein